MGFVIKFLALILITFMTCKTYDYFLLGTL